MSSNDRPEDVRNLTEEERKERDRGAYWRWVVSKHKYFESIAQGMRQTPKKEHTHE